MRSRSPQRSSSEEASEAALDQGSRENSMSERDETEEGALHLSDEGSYMSEDEISLLQPHGSTSESPRGLRRANEDTDRTRATKARRSESSADAGSATLPRPSSSDRQ